jgi:hypothetical protein
MGSKVHWSEVKWNHCHRLETQLEWINIAYTYIWYDIYIYIYHVSYILRCSSGSWLTTPVFNLKKFYTLPTNYLFPVYLRTEQRLLPYAALRIEFYNRDSVCGFCAVRREFSDVIQLSDACKGGHVVVWVTALLTGMLRVRFPMVSLEFFSDIIRPHCGPGVDSASHKNEYKEYFLGVKAAGA